MHDVIKNYFLKFQLKLLKLFNFNFFILIVSCSFLVQILICFSFFQLSVIPIGLSVD